MISDSLLRESTPLADGGHCGSMRHGVNDQISSEAGPHERNRANFKRICKYALHAIGRTALGVIAKVKFIVSEELDSMSVVPRACPMAASPDVKRPRAQLKRRALTARRSLRTWKHWTLLE